MSIFLRTEDMWDMPLDGECRSSDDGGSEKHITHWFGNIAYVLVGIFCKICWRFKYHNLEKLRAFKGKRGAIVIANHSSFVDAACLYLSARPSQWIRPMARENLFNNKLLGQIISRVGGFPVKRDSSDRSSLKRAVACIKRGELVGVMPEGTRRGRGTAEIKLHAGVSFIAKMAGCAPIIPLGIRGCDQIKPKDSRMHFNKVEMFYGDPILLSDFDMFEKSDRLAACTWYAMREVFALRDGIDSESVDMKALFPFDKDFTEEFKSINIPKHSAEEVANM